MVTATTHFTIGENVNIFSKHFDKTLTQFLINPKIIFTFTNFLLRAITVILNYMANNGIKMYENKLSAFRGCCY